MKAKIIIDGKECEIVEKIPESRCYACKFGGNKRYNYGFASGMSLFCRKEKKWLVDMKVCPLDLTNNQPMKEEGGFCDNYGNSSYEDTLD